MTDKERIKNLEELLLHQMDLNLIQSKVSANLYRHIVDNSHYIVGGSKSLTFDPNVVDDIYKYYI